MREGCRAQGAVDLEVEGPLLGGLRYKDSSAVVAEHNNVLAIGRW